MSAQRNKLLAFTLVGLTSVSAALFYFSTADQRPEIDKGLFKVAESEKIDRVTLRSSDREVELAFEANRWHVNGKWDADMKMIKVLMATLKQVEARRPVAASIRDSIVHSLQLDGTRVVVSELGEEKMNFLAGGNNRKTEAWFLKEGDTQPYVMTIPGYRVYVAGILELDEGGWRNKRIFDFNWRNFRTLTASYTKEHKQNFQVEMKNKYFGIKDLPSADTTKVNNYLDALSLLFADRFIGQGQAKVDSLSAKAPAVRIEIKDIANRTYVLELFEPDRRDTEVFGRTTEGEMVAFDKGVIAEIVRGREYFVSGKGR